MLLPIREVSTVRCTEGHFVCCTGLGDAVSVSKKPMMSRPRATDRDGRHPSLPKGIYLLVRGG